MRYFFFLFILAMSSSVFAQEPVIGPGVSQSLAQWRAARYSDVRYKLNLTLEKMSPVLKGTIEIRLQHSFLDCQECPEISIVLDWRKVKGSENLSTVTNVFINGRPASLLLPGENSKGSESIHPIGSEGKTVKTPVRFEERDEHLIFREGVVFGENVIKLDFTSPILASGSAITRHVDKEDGSEYLYSLFVPSDASTAFPVFDQPDLKARFSLKVMSPEGWRVVTNMPVQYYITQTIRSAKSVPDSSGFEFAETQPISTYVFAFAAGPWEKVADTGGNTSVSECVGSKPCKNTLPTGRASASDAELSTSIYVRKSQAEKFEPHAAETFRLMHEGVKYFENYFDYKFPFPKYDLVLIPEFPFGGMEHAGATFVRESAIIFPTEPTKSDYISRATLIFHETAHQWFGDTVTMKWFDDLWLKEGFANFMAYKALEKIMPEANAWKVFYERIKQSAYATDSTKGTTPIYQPIANLSAAKSAYGNIVYNKAPAFLRQAEFYLGEDKFQTAVRAFLKKHEFANATWEDLVKEFEAASGRKLGIWGDSWLKQRGLSKYKTEINLGVGVKNQKGRKVSGVGVDQSNVLDDDSFWGSRVEYYSRYADATAIKDLVEFDQQHADLEVGFLFAENQVPLFVFPNYGDYGYGIFLLDEKSRDYVLKNVQNEKDPFLRSMMWGALWDSVREGELDPRMYVELAIRNLPAEQDENIVASVLGRVTTAMAYYMSEPPPSGGGQPVGPTNRPSANAAGSGLGIRLENMLLGRMRTAPTLGQRITFYRAFLNIVSTENGRKVLKDMLKRTGGNTSVSECVGSKPCEKTDPDGRDSVETKGNTLPEGRVSVKAKGNTLPDGRVSALNAVPVKAKGNTLPDGRVSASDAEIPLKTKDKFDIVTRLAILGDPDAARLLAALEKTETGDDAKRYAYAAHAALPTRENREKFWKDFINNKDISESWIEAAMGPFNSIRHSELSLPYLERALGELPKLKRDRKIFFVNGWLGAFIGGQRSQQALDVINKFLADNPNLDNDLRLKILENSDIIERAVKIRKDFPARL
jgi:aminopeptidase N